MSMVHASSVKLKPASPMLRSEPAIVAGLAKATLPASKVDWQYLVEDYDRIRDLIEQTIPGFEDYNQRIRHPGGFRMPLPPTERRWNTPTGKAMFSVYGGVAEDPKWSGRGSAALGSCEGATRGAGTVESSRPSTSSTEMSRARAS